MSVLTQAYQCGTWFVCSILRELAVSNLGQPLFCLSITWSRCRNAYRDLWIMTILQQSMTRLTNTAILLIYTSRFHWRFSGNWQEHICECNIRCFWSPSHLSLGSDQLNVTVCRTCTVCAAVGCTVDSRKLKLLENILGWLALCSSSSPHIYSTVVFGINFWGQEGRMTVWLQKTSANTRESAHSISLMAALLRDTRTQWCFITKTLRCQRVPGPWHG